jgi:hypothetical protein
MEEILCIGLSWKEPYNYVADYGFVLPVTAREPSHQKKWALETSLTFPPAAQIYMLKVSVGISHNSELGFGPAFQNWKNTDKVPRGRQMHTPYCCRTATFSGRIFMWNWSCGLLTIISIHLLMAKPTKAWSYG